MPKRIQRKRTKGWKMPEGAVYVGRPSKWGNPYAIGQAVGPNAIPFTAKDAMDSYLGYIVANQHDAERFRLPIAELRGKNLCCWCPLESPCHADVLLEIANS